jgi:type IV pilus assembly protein PilC
LSIDLRNITITNDSDSSDAAQKKESKDLFSFLNVEISLIQKKLSNEKKEEFYSELGMLLSSGLDLRTVFFLKTQETQKSKHSSFYSAILRDLVDGHYLSEALKRTNYITPHEYYSIKIGEESGQLNEVLKDLSEFFKRKIKQRRQLISTFSYPIMIVVTALVVITFMLNFIVPMFEDVFKRFNGELPAITRWILSASKHFKASIGWIILILFIIIGAALMLRKTDIFRKYSAAFVMRIPLVSTLMNKIYQARFCQSMALMSAARIPLINALE